MTEEAHAPAGPSGAAPRIRPARPARPIGDVPLEEVERLSTGIGEFDRVLGGGLVPGVAALCGGEPGVGKSTLLLQAAQALAAAGRTVLYVTAEESAAQVRLRAERLGTLADGLLVASESDMSAVLGLADAHRPAVLVVDSIQTVSDAQLHSAPGSVGQVRECAAALTRHAKAQGTATILVGHVTKDGALAGPRALEHLVDAVVTVEGDRYQALRLLRATKNRFGPTGEVGCFEMTGDGLREVSDPSRHFLSGHDHGTAGVAATVTVEGPRPLAVEVQALVAPTGHPQPRRQASGLDGARLPLLVAVLDRRAGVHVNGSDLFTSAVGGVRIREPAVDLAVCVAIASAVTDVPLPRGVLAVGEVGLAGEVRSVSQLERRLAEAERLGFSDVVLPAGQPVPTGRLRVHPVRHLGAALDVTVRRPSTPVR